MLAWVESITPRASNESSKFSRGVANTLRATVAHSCKVSGAGVVVTDDV